jgi:type VI secretion system secreted protein Hcp
MAFQCYVTIEGTIQGTFTGDSAANGAVGKAGAATGGRITVLAFDYGVTTPSNSASGQTSGKRQHSPVSFVKEWDAASPQLFQACCNNETLKSVLFEFVEPDAQGNQQVSHTITLTNATITAIKFDIQGPVPSSAGTAQDLEEIAMVFQKIYIVCGQTSASDTWIAGSAGVVTAGSTPTRTAPGITAGGAASSLVGGPTLTTVASSRTTNVGAATQTTVGGARPTNVVGATHISPISPPLGTVPIRGRLAGLNRPPQQRAATTTS